MAKAFKRLERVLKLEAQQGYKNKAVVGGIRQFATFWVGQAEADAVDEQDRAFVQQVAELLGEYGRLSGPEARRKAIENLLEKLNQRKQRVGTTAPPKQQAPPPVQEKKQAPPEQKEQAPRKKQRPPAGSKPKSTEPRSRRLAAQEVDVPGLQQPVTAVKGIGPKKAELLDKVGAQTIWDLIYLFPRRYDDYTLMKPINRVAYGDTVTVIGTIWETRVRRGRNNQAIVQTTIGDGTGRIQATWFNQRWLAEKLKTGMQIVLSGKVDQFLGRPVFNSPEWEPLEMEPLRTRRIVPVYPLTKGLTSNQMRDLMQKSVQRWAPHLPDPLPESLRKKHNLEPLSNAVWQAHFPDSQLSLHHARRRLIFDELFLLQIGMQVQRRDWQGHAGIAIQPDPAVLVRFHNQLPFEFTGAQKRVIEEIAADMARDVPMNRLLQGDVGAGKTVVAAAALVMTASVGYQSALMAPTEILAEQHYQGLHKLLAAMDVSCALLTGSTPAAEREAIYAGLADGRINVAIGTHALIQEKVNFHRLALAVIDEQHRFGVDQRHALRDKVAADATTSPHLLTMSATPIPRSLALSLYGDLDLAILDEMPPGRQEIKTRWLATRERERGYAFIRGQLREGRQAYIIYPLVEASDKIDAQSAVEEFARLQAEVFADFRVGLVHGRLKSADKEAVMRQFYQGELDVLVSTTVIEVGVDVPNSTIIMIENANRFGLAQLHQLRGRVGRGTHQSYCLLIADTENGDAEERLAALETTNDGFVLAEKDLEIRGPGEFFGRRQSGLPELQLASLLDMEMLELAQNEARALFSADPELLQPEHENLRTQVSRFWEKAGDFN